MHTIGVESDIFRKADYEMKKRFPEDEKPPRRIKVVPMPKIDSNPNVKGPIKGVTQAYKDAYYKREKEKKENKERNFEQELIILLARKAKINKKLAELNPRKKKDNKKIISLNFQLRDIEREIRNIQNESGINLNELNRGSKLGRFWAAVKRKCSKIQRKAKKFFERHDEAITGVLLVAVPVILTLVVKKLFLI